MVAIKLFTQYVTGLLFMALDVCMSWFADFLALVRHLINMGKRNTQDINDLNICGLINSAYAKNKV
jgi:hypothetical protein